MCIKKASPGIRTGSRPIRGQSVELFERLLVVGLAESDGAVTELRVVFAWRGCRRLCVVAWSVDRHVESHGLVGIVGVHHDGSAGVGPGDGGAVGRVDGAVGLDALPRCAGCVELGGGYACALADPCEPVAVVDAAVFAGDTRVDERVDEGGHGVAV